MLAAVSYLIYFERHVRSSAAHHLAAAVMTSGRSAARRVRLLSDVVRRTSSRMLAITVVTVVFIVSWYPLQVLTIIDPGLRHPFKVVSYRLVASAVRAIHRCKTFFNVFLFLSRFYV